MLHINPQRLKHWREKRNMSMQDLAERSSVDKSTIYRIESGTPKRKIRAGVLGNIAKALSLSEEELTSEANPTVEEHRLKAQDKSQVSVRLENGPRNAFSFVSQRYGIKPATITRLAPLLFVMVAEDSLRKRAERLAALHNVHTNSGMLPRTYSDAAGDFELAEERSILSKDIFGLQLDDSSIQPLFFSSSADWVGQWNPFEAHINEWFEQAGEAGGITEWREDGPYYSVCPEEALAAACGDEAAASALQDGSVGIHEIPNELWINEMAEQRLQWLQTRVAEVTAEREELARAWNAENKRRRDKIFARLTTKVSPEEEIH